jgi:hypothetical protein
MTAKIDKRISAFIVFSKRMRGSAKIGPLYLPDFHLT